MGHSRKRLGDDGRPRYTAYFEDARGRRRSAGTYATRREADSAWQDAEGQMRAGRPNSPDAGRLLFITYVNDVWFPNHVLEPTTRESYRYCLDRHIVPWFGPMKMRDILPMHVREWVTDLVARGVSPAQIRHLKIILSAAFTTALNDFVIAIHPCRGVKSPTVPIKDYRIVTPSEYTMLAAALPNDTARLLVETVIGTGLRWGELTELRPRDIHWPSAILTVRRTVNEVNPAYHPTGDRFHVKAYPKSKRPRRFKIDADLVDALQRHVNSQQVGTDELLFNFDLVATSPIAPTLVDAALLGSTDPNGLGRSYPHGTLSAYTAGGCRCTHCRSGFARYRAQRRAIGLDSPRLARSRDTDGHIPRDWFRLNIWYPACSRAGLDPRPRLHDLRHAHASWLLAGGADLQVVRDRLGHRSITTTEKYLHTLPTADETALAALRRIRGTAIRHRSDQ